VLLLYVCAVKPSLQVHAVPAALTTALGMLLQMRPLIAQVSIKPVDVSKTGSNPGAHIHAVRSSLETEFVTLQGWQMPPADGL
jgi:hypothetical protein